MNPKRIMIFSNFTFENWQNLILAAILCFYSINFFASFGRGAVGDDYVAFWSVGKIADENGYSKIYDLDILRSVQIQASQELGFFVKTDDLLFSPTPVPYFALFILPLQLLSKITLVSGYWLWITINLIILLGYLVFFLRKIDPGSITKISDLKLLLLVFVSYPVFMNFTNGQVNVFLLVCAGEFIRCAVKKATILSGIWLGGLLLKPQLLILIIPLFLISRNWRVLKGFIISSGIILIASAFLSGFTGMKALVNLWTKYSSGMSSNTPEIMINWRMVGLNLNDLFNTSLGWVITGLGMLITIIAVYFLIKYKPPFGSSQWVMVILGVFSATLAITWHSHYYMAMVLIPFLIYASVHKMLPEKIIFYWGIVTPAAWFGMIIISLFDVIFAKIGIIDYLFMVIAFSGFILNLAILFSTSKRSLNNLYGEQDARE